MDVLFLELIGKPKLNQAKLITIIADNFSFLEDQSQFLRATFAIPEVKKLPFKDNAKKLIQIGPLQQEVSNQVRKADWFISLHSNLSGDVCQEVIEDLAKVESESIVFINDVSKLELTCSSAKESQNLLKHVYLTKRETGCFVVALYQNSTPSSSSKFLRNLEYISDAVVRAQSCKAGYFTSMWWQTVPVTQTLIPPRVETSYYTCKIGKFYYSNDLLCFYEKKKVSKNYDVETDTCLNPGDSDEDASDTENKDKLSDKLKATTLKDVVEDAEDVRDSTLPFTQAQNPEQSRIFYYPDKEDDIDEDDPDNDLGI